MIDVKKVVQEKSELKEVWDLLVPGTPFPDKRVALWLVEYDRDEVESAIVELSKREDKVGDGVNYVEKVLRNARLQNMTVEERKAHISAIRSLAGAIGARKKHEAELAAVRQELAEVCRTLPEVAGNCEKFASGVGSGFGSGSEVGSDAVQIQRQERYKPAAAPPPVPPRPREEKAAATPKTGNRKTIKTAKGEQPKPGGFDGWTNVQRTEWIACTCEPLQGFGDGEFMHREGCAAKALDGDEPKPKAKAAALPAGVPNDDDDFEETQRWFAHLNKPKPRSLVDEI
jgi:hypothetical protein